MYKYKYKHITHKRFEEEQEPETEREKKPETVVVQLEVDKIGFYGDVTRRSMTDLVAFLYAKVQELPIPVHASELPKLYLFISTNGGSLYDALGAYDHISRMKKRVHLVTVAEGFVASAGTLLMMAGSEKLIMKNSGMLFHQLRSCVQGKFQDMEDDVNACKWLMKKLCRIYKQNSTLEMSNIRALLSREKTLSAKRCIDYGFVNGYFV
jgi:ATP-dependent protease ClpP protease subunit